MKWIFVLVVISVGAVCALLGLTAGINVNPSSTTKFIPDWGSLADWVSGMGSVSAAIVALYLADRQRRENTARIEITQYYTKDNLAIDLVSTGERPAMVRGVYIRSPNHKKEVMLNRVPVTGSEKMAGRYEYGETRRLTIDKSVYPGIAYEIEHEMGPHNWSDLELIVGTGTAEFRDKLNAQFIQELINELSEPV